MKQSPGNSSKPPSSDGLAKPAPKSLRGRSGRQPGRPAGGEGTTLSQVADPDVVVRHVTDTCGGCGGGLTGAAEVAVTRRQVFDIPRPEVVVTEHQIVTVSCPCAYNSTGPTPAGATAPAVYGPRIAAIGVYLLHGQFLSIGHTTDAIRDLFGLSVAAATVTAWVTHTALGVIDKVLPVIRDHVRHAPVAHYICADDAEPAPEAGFAFSGNNWFENRYSPTCRTSWARAGRTNPATYRVESRYLNGSHRLSIQEFSNTWLWMAMVNNANLQARACIDPWGPEFGERCTPWY